MYRPNFCVECGERLARRGWLALISRAGRGFCENCARRLGRLALTRALTIVAIVAISAFALGRWLRPAAPPLLIQRAANSPLSDSVVNLNGLARTTNGKGSEATNQDARAVNGDAADDTVYLCGARTKKGTPCRRRVHFAGERCYQHKAMPAMVPLEKLVVKSK